MSFVIELSPEDERKLQQRAAVRGKPAADYARELLKRELDAPLSLLDRNQLRVLTPVDFLREVEKADQPVGQERGQAEQESE